MPEQAAAIVLLLFSLLLKTLMVWRLGGTWLITLGSLFQFTPMFDSAHFGTRFCFSLLQAILFLLRFWTLSLFVRLITPSGRTSRAIEAMNFFCRPFSLLPQLLQPLVLLFLHLCIVLFLTRSHLMDIMPSTQNASSATDFIKMVNSPFVTGSLWAQMLKSVWLAFLSLADGIYFLIRGLFIAIIGSLLATLLQARSLAMLCSECAELLLGRFSRRGAQGMGFDFTPLIFFFVADLGYRMLGSFLFQLINHPLLNQ